MSTIMMIMTQNDRDRSQSKISSCIIIIHAEYKRLLSPPLKKQQEKKVYSTIDTHSGTRARVLKKYRYGIRTNLCSIVAVAVLETNASLLKYLPNLGWLGMITF